MKTPSIFFSTGHNPFPLTDSELRGRKRGSEFNASPGNPPQKLAYETIAMGQKLGDTQLANTKTDRQYQKDHQARHIEQSCSRQRLMQEQMTSSN